MTDLWLYREKNWFILNHEQCGKETGPYPHNSLIWHQCPKPHPSYKGCWRVSERSLDMPCGVCGEVCPEGLQGLWRLHNWDTMDDLFIHNGGFYLHGTTKKV